MIHWTEFYLKFLSFPIFLTRLAQQLSALWMEGLIGVLIDWFSFSRGNKTWVICAKADMIMHYSGAEKFGLGYFGLPSMSITSPTKSITSPITLTWLIPTYLRQHSHQLRPLKKSDHNKVLGYQEGENWYDWHVDPHCSKIWVRKVKGRTMAIFKKEDALTMTRSPFFHVVKRAKVSRWPE